jgi:hypothetical protein
MFSYSLILSLAVLCCHVRRSDATTPEWYSQQAAQHDNQTQTVTTTVVAEPSTPIAAPPPPLPQTSSIGQPEPSTTVVVPLPPPPQTSSTATYISIQPEGTPPPKPSNPCKPNPESTFPHVNATTNFTVPAFQPPGQPAYDWTINVGLIDTHNKTSNASEDRLLLWITTPNAKDNTINAPDHDLSSPTLPYEGCLIQLIPKNPKGVSDQDGDGEAKCEGVFSDKCYDAIHGYAKRSADFISKQGWSDRNPAHCLHMARYFDEECGTGDKDEGWRASAARCELFSSNFKANRLCCVVLAKFTTSTDVFGSGPSCAQFSFAPQSLLHAPFPLPAAIGDDNTYGNFTNYDRLTSTASPILLVGWLKESSNQSMEKWGDARLLCPQPNRFTPGSRGFDDGNGNENADATASAGVRLRGNGFNFEVLGIWVGITVGWWFYVWLL